jgi:hypothetical protein
VSGLTLPQFGIFAQGTHAHHFLEFDLRSGVTGAEAVASFKRLRTSEVSAGGINLVIAFGARIWQELAPQHTPAVIGDFREVVGSDGQLIGTPSRQNPWPLSGGLSGARRSLRLRVARGTWPLPIRPA